MMMKRVLEEEEVIITDEEYPTTIPTIAIMVAIRTNEEHE